MLETFSFRLERCHDQAVAHEMRGVPDALAGAKAVNRTEVDSLNL